MKTTRQSLVTHFAAALHAFQQTEVDNEPRDKERKDNVRFRHSQRFQIIRLTQYVATKRFQLAKEI